ncbi:MAG TPA: hypothetical protein VFT99_18530, partial [Roseiflexaceae bacterium]|nr:hypothetical protein [Roseiflexaceae bacterium]
LPLAHSAAGTFDSEPQLAWLNIPAHSAAAMLDRVAACEAERAMQQPAGAQTMLAIRRDDHYQQRRDTTWAHSCHV